MKHQVRKKITGSGGYGYERKIIPIPDHWGLGTMVLIAWEPGSRTVRHDHDSDGVALVLSGEVVVVPQGAHKMIRLGPEAWLSEAPGQTHIVGSEIGARTLHIYKPGFGMTPFPDDEMDQALLKGDTFAGDDFYDYRMLSTGETFCRPNRKMISLHHPFDRTWVSKFLPSEIHAQLNAP
jgi:hypothetical protein